MQQSANHALSWSCSCRQAVQEGDLNHASVGRLVLVLPAVSAALEH